MNTIGEAKPKTKKQLAAEKKARNELEQAVRRHGADLYRRLEKLAERWFDYDAQEYRPDTPAEVLLMEAADRACAAAAYSPSAETLAAYADAYVAAQRAYAALLLASADDSAAEIRELAANLKVVDPRAAA